MRRRLMHLVDWLAIFWGGYIVFVTWGEFTLYWTMERPPEPVKTLLKLYKGRLGIFSFRSFP